MVKLGIGEDGSRFYRSLGYSRIKENEKSAPKD
jgi:hypothetical protein